MTSHQWCRRKSDNVRKIPVTVSLMCMMLQIAPTQGQNVGDLDKNKCNIIMSFFVLLHLTFTTPHPHCAFQTLKSIYHPLSAWIHVSAPLLWVKKEWTWHSEEKLQELKPPSLWVSSLHTSEPQAQQMEKEKLEETSKMPQIAKNSSSKEDRDKWDENEQCYN